MQIKDLRKMSVSELSAAPWDTGKSYHSQTGIRNVSFLHGSSASYQRPATKEAHPYPEMLNSSTKPRSEASEQREMLSSVRHELSDVANTLKANSEIVRLKEAELIEKESKLAKREKQISAEVQQLVTFAMEEKEKVLAC